MPKNHMKLVVVATLVMLVTATFAIAQAATPHRFRATLDGNLVMKINPVDGRTWSAWTYRQGAETDIAVSYQDSDGIWNEPMLIGAQDGIEQTQPAMTIDHNGNVYLAWAESNTGRVLVSALGFRTEHWSTPTVVNDVRVRAASPALMIAAQQRLVVGFVANGTVRLVELRLLPRLVEAQMSDGPDPVGQTSDGDGDGLLGGNHISDGFGNEGGIGEVYNKGRIQSVAGQN